MNLRRGRRAAAMFLALCGLPACAGATDFVWTGSVNALWSNANNWNPIGVPLNNDNASIYRYSPSTDSSFSSIFDSTATAASLGTLIISSDSDGSQTTSTAKLSLSAGSLAAAVEQVGKFVTSSGSAAPEYGLGWINQTGGTHNVGSLALGDQSSYVAGMYTLTGSAVLNVTNEQIGYPLLGNGTFNQTGGTHTVSTLNVGGPYNFSGGTLNAIGATIGGGTFAQSGGSATIGTLHVGGILIGPFGVQIPTPGNVTVTGGTLSTTNALLVGDTSAGSLNISGSGFVTTPELDNYSDVELSGGTLNIGTLDNQGTFNWTGGALASRSAVTFDSSAPAYTLGGLLNTGVSLTNNRTLSVNGTETLGNTGSFTLTIPAGGANIARQLNISSKGKLNLTGGSLTCTAIDLVGQNQLFNWTAGTLTLLNAATFDPGASTISTGSVFADHLALSNRSLIISAETLTSSIRGQTFALTVGTNANNLVSGSLIVDSLGSLTISGGTLSAASTVVDAAGKLLYSGGTFSPGSFSVVGSGAATFSAASPTIVMNSLTVDSTAKLDLGSSRLIVHSGDQAALRSGLQNGSIKTSTTASNPAIGVGYAANSDIGYSTFGGMSVVSADTLVKVTYFGDANLDGQVNIADLGALATHYGQSNQYWSAGDFNYDGVVNIGDLGMLATNYGAGASGPLELSFPQALAEVETQVGRELPDPSGAGFLAVAAMACVRRRGKFPCYP